MSCSVPETEAAPRHVPDYFMHDFSVRVFDADGKLKSELTGKQGRHYPDTDTVEIDQVFVRTFSPHLIYRLNHEVVLLLMIAVIVPPGA